MNRQLEKTQPYSGIEQQFYWLLQTLSPHEVKLWLGLRLRTWRGAPIPPEIPECRAIGLIRPSLATIAREIQMPRSSAHDALLKLEKKALAQRTRAGIVLLKPNFAGGITTSIATKCLNKTGETPTNKHRQRGEQTENKMSDTWTKCLTSDDVRHSNETLKKEQKENKMSDSRTKLDKDTLIRKPDDVSESDTLSERVGSASYSLSNDLSKEGARPAPGQAGSPPPLRKSETLCSKGSQKPRPSARSQGSRTGPSCRELEEPGEGLEVKRLDREAALALVEELRRRSEEALRAAAKATDEHWESNEDERRDRHAREAERREFLKRQADELLAEESYEASADSRVH